MFKLPLASKLLICSILLVKMATFMSYPFLAIRLENLGYDPFKIGIIIGLPYLFSGLSGIFAGNIADQIGQKRAMILSLLVGGISFFGLEAAENMATFLLFNLLILLSSVIFEPAVSTLIMLSTPQDLCSLAFRYRYIAINLGASIGPGIGGLLAYYGVAYSFLITGALFLIYLILLSFVDKKKTKESSTYSLSNLKETLYHMGGDHAFLYLVTANFFVSMTYCQMFSALPQILNRELQEGLQLYSIMLSVNPITVVVTGLFFSHLLSRQNPSYLFSLGGIILFLAFLGFHLFPITYWNYIELMILFTLGEIILMPTASKFLSDLSPVKYKGAYLGSESCYHLGFFTGNFIGGFLLQKSYPIFIFCSFCVVVGTIAYRLSYQTFLKEKAVSLYQYAEEVD